MFTIAAGYSDPKTHNATLAADDASRTKDVAENRSVERFDLGLKAFVSVFDEADKSDALAMQTRDISTNGAYLLTESPLPVGTKVRVDMILSLDELKKLGGKALIKTSGQVLRAESDGMAIYFDRNSRIVPFSSNNTLDKINP